MIPFCLTSASAGIQKIIRDFIHGLEWITNIPDDIVIMDYGDAGQDRKRGAILNTS